MGAGGSLNFTSALGSLPPQLFSHGSAVIGGIRLAFMVGATLSLFAMRAAFFVRKPEPPEYDGEGEPAFAGH